MIYFAQIRDGGAIKIGFTEKQNERFRRMRWEFDAIVCVLGVMPGGKDLEAEIQARFAHIQADAVYTPAWKGHYYDWFHPEPELLAFIKANCQPWDGTDERGVNTHPEKVAPPIGSLRAQLAIGSRFGRWTVTGKPVSVNDGGPKRRIKYPVRCDCGAEKVVRADQLTSGESASCGCLLREQKAELCRSGRVRGNGQSTHDERQTRIYKIRNNMLMRCRKLGTRNTRAYGDRGIDVCPEWRASWEAFRDWAMASGYRDGLTIDRIDVNRGYEPGNCRWVTMLDNRRAERQSTVYLEVFGERKSMAQWAEDARCVVPYKTLHMRLKRGWDAEQAITTPQIGHGFRRAESTGQATNPVTNS